MHLFSDDLFIKPRFDDAPLPDDGRRADSHHLRRFLDRQTAEKFEFDELRLVGSFYSEFFKSFVERDELGGALVGNVDIAVVERDFKNVAAAFVAQGGGRGRSGSAASSAPPRRKTAPGSAS